MKTIAFTVCDKEKLPWAEHLKKSFAKFHPDIEFKIYTGKTVEKWIKQDPMFFYKQKPWIMRELIKDYDLVIGIDADSIITGPLTEVLDGDYDVGVVRNFNRVDTETFGQVGVFNIHPQEYLNCGLVAVRDKEFVDLWWRQCNSARFNTLQYREQDLLNILVFYGSKLIKNFDDSAFYGVSAKDLWKQAIVKDDSVVIEFADDQGNVVLTRPIKVIHVAGGNMPNKMEIDNYFAPEVAAHIKKLYE